MRAIIAAFARNSVFSTVGMLIIFAGGALAALMIVRERFPVSKIDLVTVLVPYPGADPEEVEEAVCTKIEEAINGVEGIKEYTTKSFENYGMAYIEVLEKYDTNVVAQEITSRIDAISTFPGDAEKPIITRPVLPDEVIQVGLTGTLDERRLKEWAEDVKRDLQALPQISQVEIVGAREYEIAIEVSEERLREYGLTFDQVAMAVRASSQTLAGGTLRTEGEEIRLRTVGRKYWGDEFRHIQVLAGPRGENITLDKVAKVTDGFTEDYVSARLNGEPAIVIRVFKTPSEDAIAIAKAVRKYVNEQQSALPKGLRMQAWHDLSDYINASLNTLTVNAIQGIAIVFLALWLFLDLRLGIWATNGVPISVCGTLIILWMTGNTINLVSLFAMLLITGMVVDDAIVMGEIIYFRRQKGESALDAAVNGTMDMLVPILASGVTMIIGFLPLFFVGGFMGKFIWVLPFVIIASLAISAIENFFMLPSHLSRLPDFNSPEYQKRIQRNPLRKLRGRVNWAFDASVEKLYLPLLHAVMKNPYVTTAVFAATVLFGAGMLQGGFVKFVMFPPVDSYILNGRMEFPSGTPIEVTQAAVKRMEEALYRVGERGDMKTVSGEPLVDGVFSLTGASMDVLPGEKASLGSHYGGVKAEILKNPARGFDSEKVINAWEEELGHIPGLVSLKLKGDDSGPPGRPLEIWLQGKDMSMLAAAAEDLKKEIDNMDGVSQVESDFRPGKNEIRFELKPSARALGLTVGDLARQLYSGFYGTEALRIQRGRDDIRVKVRYPREERSSLAELYNVRIRTPLGFAVPLRAVATLSYEPGYTVITRTGGLRRIAVSAALDSQKISAMEVVDNLKEGFFQGLRQRHLGLSIAVRGEQKNTSESLRPLLTGFPLALVGIYFIIALSFSSHLQTLLVILTIPFAFVGAIIGHYLWGCPITMFSIFGVVGLTGVVVNSGIILIEGFNSFIENEESFLGAIQQSAQRRFRAAFLVVVTDIFGTLPMVLETERQTQFIIPMIIGYCSGLLASAFMVMLLFPALLIIVNDGRCFFRWLSTGHWPSREEVEPASHRYHILLDEESPERLLPETPASGGPQS